MNLYPPLLFVLTATALLADPSPGPLSKALPLSILTASLPGHILYWRLATFSPKTTWPDLVSQFHDSSAQGVVGAICDLRSNIAAGDYAGAARFLGLLEPQDTGLVKYVSDSKSDTLRHPFRSPIVVLVNNQTTGAASTLAACLKTDGAIVIGPATTDSHILVPDIALSTNDSAEKAALALIDRGQILDVIGEAAERHRMNEAALVQGDDPEWDAYLASMEKNSADGRLKLPTVRDPVLIAALDSLKAIEVTLRPPLPAASPDAPVETTSSNP